MLYNINDCYHINQAIDAWILELEDTDRAEEEKKDFIVYKERCLPDD